MGLVDEDGSVAGLSILKRGEYVLFYLPVTVPETQTPQSQCANHVLHTGNVT